MNETSGTITKAELDRLRGRLGQVVQVSELPYLTEANIDAIRRWAMATGDRNPLYLDADYAATGPHGAIVAPPCLPYAFSRLSIGYRGGLPGVHSMFGGSHWRWFKPLPVGARVSAETRFTDLVELNGRFAGRMFKQLSRTTFVADTDDGPFAEVQGWGMRTERQTARKRGKYGGTRLATYTPDDIAALAEEYRQERLTGSETLYWDDVEVGSRIPSIVRGPYTATIAVAFEQAWGGLFVRAHGAWFDYIREHPAISIPNAYGVPEPPEAVHWDSQLARMAGVPEAYDYGPERISWLSCLVTNWAGDEGFLEELYCEIRGFNLIGDLSRGHGEVAEVMAPDEDGNGRVRLNVWIENQRGDTTAKGWALVRLRAR
ncbi:MaoC family dehydratase N-terminal domain-containing protein [Streptomyces sp. NPDC057636]|uniref:FAS1-like dehydratase domain-containing protein n=1 Tax=Streptomyces sp. NPDC057636 TaxID=3346189 RepID=UPI0036A3FB24